VKMQSLFSMNVEKCSDCLIFKYSLISFSSSIVLFSQARTFQNRLVSSEMYPVGLRVMLFTECSKRHFSARFTCSLLMFVWSPSNIFLVITRKEKERNELLFFCMTKQKKEEMKKNCDWCVNCFLEKGAKGDGYDFWL